MLCALYISIFLFAFIGFAGTITELLKGAEFNKERKASIGIAIPILIGGVFVIKYLISVA